MLDLLTGVNLLAVWVERCSDPSMETVLILLRTNTD